MLSAEQLMAFNAEPGLVELRKRASGVRYAYRKYKSISSFVKSADALDRAVEASSNPLVRKGCSTLPARSIVHCVYQS